MVAGAIFEAVLHIFIPPRFVAIDFAGLSADLFLLGGFGWLALNARRIWPIWAAAFELLSLASHIARTIPVDIEPMAYSIMKSAPTGMAIITLAIGTFAHVRRVGRFGSDPSWMDWDNLK